MSQEEGRVIKPPIEQITDGRVFRPLPALRYKKWLKYILASLGFWGVFIFSLYGPPIITLLVLEAIPLNLWFASADWIVGSQVYWIFTTLWLIPAIVWTHIYVKRVEYSVVGWEGERMPEIYVRKGVITITKKFVPFRTITNVETRAGPFDRLFGMGSLKVETAGEKGGHHATGLMTLLITRLLENSSEESIDGIVFYKELEDFVLEGLRPFSVPMFVPEQSRKRPRRKGILNRQTLRAFEEIRAVLKEQVGMSD